MIPDTCVGKAHCYESHYRKDLSQMTTAQIVLSVVYFIVALGLIAVVMLQSGKSAGLSGAIAGGADTFLSKNKAKSADARLAKMTKWIAIVFMILTLVLCLVPGASA